MEDLAPDVQRELRDAEERTATNTGMQFNIALNYGGRAEIVEAARRMAGRRRAARRDRRGALRVVSLHRGPARSGSADPHERRDARQQLPALADRLRGDLGHRHAVARLPPAPPARSRSSRIRSAIAATAASTSRRLPDGDFQLLSLLQLRFSFQLSASGSSFASSYDAGSVGARPAAGRHRDDLVSSRPGDAAPRADCRRAGVSRVLHDRASAGRLGPGGIGGTAVVLVCYAMWLGDRFADTHSSSSCRTAACRSCEPRCSTRTWWHWS